MVMRNGIRPLVEVMMIGVIPFNRPVKVDISLQGIQYLSGMVVMMSG